jgi:ankyrin repeat protein
VLNGSKDGEGFMLLHIAAYFGHLQLAKNLIAMGSRV